MVGHRGRRRGLLSVVSAPHSGVDLEPLGRSFFARDPLELAPDLLNKLLVHDGRVARIVEVEAYRGVDDPASHAFRGPTPRTEVMFGPAGHLYVYFSYGMHWCANVVAGETGTAAAVLIRAAHPIVGIDAMRVARGAPRRDLDLTNGPAKLCKGMGIDGRLDGIDITGPASLVRISDDGMVPPPVPTVGGRVGISVAADLPWRFSVPGEPYRSRPLPRP